MGWRRDPWLVALLALGAALRAVPYILNRSLWFDEAMLALNVVERSYAQLTEPLHYLQLAPLGFLVASRAAVALLGDGERALRLLPLLASLASLPLVYALGSTVASRRVGLLALALLAVSPAAIYYGSEFKPYSLDLALAAALLLLAAKSLAHGLTQRRLALLGAVGIASVWCSFPACLVLGAAGLALMVHELFSSEHHGRAYALLAVMALWLASFAASYVESPGSTGATRQSMREHWEERGFVPMPPRSWQDMRRVATRVTGIFSHPSRWPGTSGAMEEGAVDTPVLMLFLWCVGALVLWRRGRSLLLLLILPVLLAVAVASARLYPLEQRTSLFLLPAVAVLAAVGLDRLWSRSDALLRGVGPALVAVALALPGWTDVRAFRGGAQREELRPVLKELARRFQPGDALYVYHGASMAFAFYSRHGNLTGGGPPPWKTDGTVVFGRRAVDPEAYARGLESLRGRSRVWLLFSHVTRIGTLDVDAEEFLLMRLRRSGSRVRDIRRVGASAHLYDLSHDQGVRAR